MGAGILAFLFIVALAGGAFVALIGAADTTGNPLTIFDYYLWRVLRFTVLQAVLSTVLSVGLAIPVARAIARRPDFTGRAILLRLFMLPLGLPPIVAALGLLNIWGREGLINGLREMIGYDTPFSIYGLTGVLLAHVFFNLPLSARLLLSSLERVPDEYWKLSAILRFSGFHEFRHIEWPALRRDIGGVAALIFMLCITSFTLVLILGGGPGATTLEVAIYQSLRFDFDPQRAVILALTQITLTMAVVAMLAMIGMPRPDSFGTDRQGRLFSGASTVSCLADIVIIAAAALFLVLPLAAIVVSGAPSAPSLLLNDAAFWKAATTSLILGTGASFLALLLAVSLVLSRHAMAVKGAASEKGRRVLTGLRTLLGSASSLILVVPPIVIGAGWFIFFRAHMDVFALAPMAVVTINAMMALPFVMRVLEPAFLAHAAKTDRLALALGMRGRNRLFILDWPVMRRPIALSLAFAMALSLGDLGVIALFGSQDMITLPFYLLSKMGSYRTADAAGLAFLLGLICFILMMLADRPAGKGSTPETRL